MTTAPNALDLLKNVNVVLSVELGRTQLPLKKVLELRESSVVPLDRLSDELLDVQVNGHTIAKAEILTEGNRFALKIVQMIGEESPAIGDRSDLPADASLEAAASDAIAKAAAGNPAETDAG